MLSNACLQQIEKRQSLSIEMARQQLPEISYKVTADYEIYIEYEPSDEIELPSYEALAADLSMYKMSSRTSTNTVVLGDDLYKMKSTSPLLEDRYRFDNLGEYVDSRKAAPYSLYLLSRKISN
jgi:hypothetical protein